ncbi:Ig-like domain-containing protein [Streptomyces sp. NPDC051320]|uniref:L,D-transpeptidase n=1 Tax=Streptomyces sp. NPDC051320 TaxID=3154644 RepID=UPI0034431687
MLAWAALATGAAGCSSGTTGDSAKESSPGQVIRVVPDDGEKGVAADRNVEVAVRAGRLERVSVVGVTKGRRQRLPGSISDDGLRWRSAGGRLVGGAAYTVDATATDGHSRRVARRTGFTTRALKPSFIGYFTPENRSTVGTGMIVSFRFNRPVGSRERRAAVERAIKVTARPPVPVTGHWFGGSRLDFRPRAYWKPGTAVTVAMRLRHLKVAPGVYGTQQKTVGFTVGRSQTSLVDAEAHTLVVHRDGVLLTTLPVTAGAPDHTTYNGKMVISEKYPVTRMNGSTVGFGGEYDIPDVPHALRLTRSGTFLHGNYWAPPDVFGTTNTSHGCVGLRDARGGSPHSPAGWFYDQALIGDVVEVVNSHDRQVAPDNGLGGWNLDWARWQAGSALGH